MTSHYRCTGTVCSSLVLVVAVRLQLALYIFNKQNQVQDRKFFVIFYHVYLENSEICKQHALHYCLYITKENYCFFLL